MRSDKLDLFLPAFLAVQKELKPVIKDANNPFFKSRYADLAAVYSEVQPIANAHDICITQGVDLMPGGGMVIRTILWHISGQYISSTVRLTPMPDKDDKITPQAVGSAITYARRYSLMAIFALPADDDDDGNAASGRAQPKAPTAAEKAKAKADAAKGQATGKTGLNQYDGKPDGTATADQVAELKKLAAAGGFNEAALAKRYELARFAQMSTEQAVEMIGKIKAHIGT